MKASLTIDSKRKLVDNLSRAFEAKKTKSVREVPFPETITIDFLEADLEQVQVPKGCTIYFEPTNDSAQNPGKGGAYNVAIIFINEITGASLRVTPGENGISVKSYNKGVRTQTRRLG